MKSLKENYHFLHTLLRSSPAQKRALLRTASKRQITCLCELCLNVLLGNVPVQRKKLYKYRNSIRNIAKKSANFSTKRKLLTNQVGGFLPLLLKAVVPALAGLLSNVFTSNKK